MRVGPALEQLTRRLAECPPEFLADPLIGSVGQVEAAAILADLLRDFNYRPSRTDLYPFVGNDLRRDRNRLSLVMIACWLLKDSGLAKALPTHILTFLQSEDFLSLANLNPANGYVLTGERREELARFTLNALNMFPLGESQQIASDRLMAVSSAERMRAAEETKRAAERARRIREAADARRAQEASPRYTRE